MSKENSKMHLICEKN